MPHFARDIRNLFGVKHVFFFSSGRAAIVVALRGLRELVAPDRDEVVIPAYTCYSVAAAIVRAGLKIRICDSDPSTLDYDFAALSNLDFTRVLCIFSSSLYGLPNDLTAIEQLARTRGVFMLDDAAQCLGGMFKGRRVATFGDAGVMSFDKGKNITSIEGGALLTNSEVLAKACGEIAGGLDCPSAAKDAALSLKLIAYALLVRPVPYNIPANLPMLGLGKTVFDPDFTISGYSSMASGMALELFSRLDAITEVRIANAALLKKALHGIAGIRVVAVRRNAQPVYLRYPILVEQSERRANLVRQLAKKGLGVSTSYPAVIGQIPDVASSLVDRNASFAGGEVVSRSLLTLPTHAFVRPSDVQVIADTIRRWSLG